MRYFVIADVAAPSGLVMVAGWTFLFLVIGVLIIIASVIIIRAELKKIKKMNEAALTESWSAENAETENGSAEVAETENGSTENGGASKTEEL